jgi:Domain of unknown function (DUF5658)
MTAVNATASTLGIHRRPVLFPDAYAWYVLVSALDVMVTVAVLVHLGAQEVNTFAQWSIEQFGTWGLIGLKFLSVVLVVLICEYIGQRRAALGRRLAVAAIFLSLLPVAAALAQVVYFTARGETVIQEWPRAEAASVKVIRPPGARLSVP